MPGPGEGERDRRAATATPPAPAVEVVDLDWRTPAVVVAAVIAVGAVAGLVRSTPRTLTWLVIGGLLALALNPVVDRIQDRLRCRRGIAVGAVLLIVLVAMAVIGITLGPETVRQARSLQRDIPEVVAQLTDLPLVGDTLADNDVPAKVQDWLEQLPDRLAGDESAVTGAARSVASGALAGFATLLFAVTLLLDGERLVRAGRRLVPTHRRGRADRVGRLFYQVIGKYFAGSVLVAVLQGLAVLVVALIFGVPLAPLIAVWVMIFNLVPQIGGAVGGIPFVLLAFTQGATTGVICGAFFLLYMNFENHILSPLIIGDAVNLQAATTMVGAIVGVSVAGVPGALVAVPLLGVGKAIYLELRSDGTSVIGHGRGPGPLARLVGRLRRRRHGPPGVDAAGPGAAPAG
ncbi:MAG TPA: AI-2E family transporter [Acidimicrobiales bacterium]|nr:AI-2E family transporter [Acidimicrobiales bacterium]